MALIFSTLTLKLLVVIFFILSGFYIYFKFVLYTYWRKKGIPYLEPVIPVGNFLKLVQKKCHIGETFAYGYERMKDNKVFGMYTFHKPCLLIVDPELIRCVLTKEFQSFHDRGVYCNERVDPLSGNLFFLPGKKWRNLRTKVSPAITPGKIKLMFCCLKDRGIILNQFLQEKAHTGSVVEVQELFARFTTDVIMNTVFGVNCNTLQNKDNEYRYWGKQVFEPHTFKNAIGFFAPQILHFFSIPFNDVGVQKFFITVFENTVKHRLNNNIKCNDFMDLIIQLMKKGHVSDDNDMTGESISENSKENITMAEGAAQAYIFFLAGFETSSTTAAFCLYELAINQEMQEKVRKEIFSKLGESDELSYDSLNEMTYLHKVILETLRKYPPVSLLNRVCTETIKLPDTEIIINKDIDIVIPVLGIHRDPNIYPKPMEFDPERFNEENIAARHPYHFLPFGEGPRICIGMKLGLIQVKVAIINSLRNCRVLIGPNTPIPMPINNEKMAYAPKVGVHLKVEML